MTESDRLAWIARLEIKAFEHSPFYPVERCYHGVTSLEISMTTTSLKLTDTLKQEIQHIAAEDNTTAHAFMVGTLEREVERRRLRADFIADARAAAAETDAGGPVYALDDVHHWIKARIRSRTTGEKVQDLQPVRGRGASTRQRTA